MSLEWREHRIPPTIPWMQASEHAESRSAVNLNLKGQVRPGPVRARGPRLHPYPPADSISAVNAADALRTFLSCHRPHLNFNLSALSLFSKLGSSQDRPDTRALEAAEESSPVFELLSWYPRHLLKQALRNLSHSFRFQLAIEIVITNLDQWQRVFLLSAYSPSVTLSLSLTMGHRQYDTTASPTVVPTT